MADNMWWPSFCSVLGDLWRFALGFESDALYRQTQAPGAYSDSLPSDVYRATSTSTAAAQVQKVELSQQTRYAAEHEVTVQIRSYLQANTTVKTASTDLTAYEWLAYTCTRAGRSLPWMALAMAPIGYWHQALKGQKYVTIGVTPHTQALMEWQDKQQVGQVGLVTAVAPDLSVTIEQLGAQLPGMMTRKILKPDQWRELRPVFINVR